MADQALTIVKSEALPTLTVADAPPSPRDARGMPAVSSNASDAPDSPLLAMLGPLAHPQTLSDFAHLLMLPVDEVRSAATRALALATAKAVPGAALSVAKSGLKAADALDPDLVAIASPRAGAALKVAQRANAVINKTGPAAADASEGAVSAAGYPRLTPSAPTAAPPAAPPAAPVVGPAAVDEFTAARTAKAAAAAPSGTPSTAVAPKVLNELAIMARRAKVTLTGPDYETGAQLVTQGASPQEAVAQIAASRAASAAPAAGAAATLTEEETALGAQLVKKGASPQQALQSILQMRALKNSPSFAATPTTAAANATVAARNAGGHWPGQD